MVLSCNLFVIRVVLCSHSTDKIATVLLKAMVKYLPTEAESRSTTRLTLGSQSAKVQNNRGGNTPLQIQLCFLAEY